MRIRITTDWEGLAQSLTDALARVPGRSFSRDYTQASRLEVLFRPDIDMSALEALLAELSPMRPALKPAPALLPAAAPEGEISGEEVPTEAQEGFDVEIRLGDGRPAYSTGISVHSSDDLGAEIHQALCAVGFSDHGSTGETFLENRLEYSNTTPFVRQVVRWRLKSMGISLEEHRIANLGATMRICFAERAPVAQSQAEIDLELSGDDIRATLALGELLTEAGLSPPPRLCPLETDKQPMFLFERGLIPEGSPLESKILEILRAQLARSGASPEQHPLVVRSDTHVSRIVWPMGALSRGALLPYAGDAPSRWQLSIRTDAPSEIEPLVARLSSLGYSPKIERLPSSCLGPQISVGALAQSPERMAVLEEAIQRTLADLGLARDSLSIDATLPESSGQILVDLPILLSRTGGLEERIRRCASRYNCNLYSPILGEHAELHSALSALSFQYFHHDPSPVAAPQLQHGGLPKPLLSYLVRLIEKKTGISVEAQQTSIGNEQIWIHLPSPTASPEASVPAREGEIADPSVWFTHNSARPEIPLIEASEHSVRIGPISLPRARTEDRSLVPSPEMFVHYCVEQRTAETLLHVAESVLLREPCLLEGETSVSKTSIIQLLAMLLGQPLVRLNLNGQTDTGELIGRYVPHDVTSALPIAAAELLGASELLEPESRQILMRAASERRELSQVEVQQVMANERMTVHPWRWQDGLIVSAMRRGWWVVLDELNLAEPQILERLNPLLEREPSLVLTEHDNSVFGRGGIPVHPDFRIFATMNPAEYAGRSALSPAYRDRWRGYRFVAPPAEADYRAMLTFLVSGREPSVTLRGRSFSGRTEPAAASILAEIPGIEEFLTALARFHSALERAVRNPEQHRSAQLGVRRQERYIFTRRSLLAAIDCIAYALPEARRSGTPAHEILRTALLRYYLGRVVDGGDQLAVLRLMDAAGIGLNTWAVPT